VGALESEYISVREAAYCLGLHEHTVVRLIQRGQLPARRIGRSIRIRRSHLRLFPSATCPKTRSGALSPAAGTVRIAQLLVRLDCDPPQVDVIASDFVHQQELEPIARAVSDLVSKMQQAPENSADGT